MKKKKIVIYIILAIFLLGVVIYMLPLVLSFSDENARNEFISYILDRGSIGVLIVFLIQVTQVFVAFIPGEAVEIIAGILYGTILGYIICALGVLVGTMGIFIFVRRFGKNFSDKVKNHKSLKKFDFLHSHKKLSVVIFIIYLIPATPKDLLTYVCALTNISLKEYMLLTTLAIVPSIISSTYIGANLIEGNFTGAVLMFAITGIIGIFGILFNDKILKKISKG